MERALKREHVGAPSKRLSEAVVRCRGQWPQARKETFCAFEKSPTYKGLTDQGDAREVCFWPEADISRRGQLLIRESP